MNLLSIIGHRDREIRAAWIASLITAGFTLLGGVLGVVGKLFLVDVGLSLGLAFGIYKRSRICAVIALCYFLANRVLSILQYHKAPGVEAYFLGAAFVLGVHGTFDHHKSEDARRFSEELSARYAPPN